MQNPKKQQTTAFLAIATGILLGIFFIARLTGILQWYSFPTTANEPAIKRNTSRWGSNLKKPALGSFVMFNRFDSAIGQEAISTYRCLGMPGDKIEMRNMMMFVNGKNADEGIETKNCYSIIAEDISAIIKKAGIADPRKEDENGLDVSYMNITAKEYKKIAAACNPLKDSIVSIDMPVSKTIAPFLFKYGNANWSLDNFGPLTIPVKSYFLIGDNRDNAYDSRFTGFVPEEKVAGVLFFK